MMMQVATGVCSRGFTFDIVLRERELVVARHPERESDRRRLDDMQQTKIDATTTNR